MLKKLRISQKLAIGFGLVIALLIGITTIGVQRVGVINGTLSDVRDDAAVKQRYAINFRGSVHDRAIALRDVVISDNKELDRKFLEQIEELKSNYNDARSKMKAAMNRSTDDKGRQLLSEIENAESRALVLTDELLEIDKSEGPIQAQKFLLKSLSDAYSHWLDTINDFIDYKEAYIASEITEIRAIGEGFSSFMMILTCLSVLLAVIAAYVIVRDLIKTLGGEPGEVAEIIKRLSDGDLNQRVETQYPDSVMGTLKDTMLGLTQIIQDVRTASDSVMSASQELMGTSADNSKQIAHQSRESEQIASAINQMAATVNEISGYAANAATAASQADEEANKGSHVIDDTKTEIEKLARTLEDASTAVKEVSTDSANIEKIIEVINAIAEQTNLLALNAAIEAARAGTHGRGFAVVADEVRSLATRTQDSTREIREMIAKLQTGAGKASSMMITSQDMAKTAVGKTHLSEEAIAKILAEVKAINEMNDQIATASEEQSSVAEEVNRNITRIHDSITETSAGAEQVAASSNELSRLSDDLKSKVSFFKV